MSKNKDYICSCFKITKKDLKQYIANGYTEYKALQDHTNIGSKCSKCKTRTEQKFNKYLEKQKA